jgi:hypothetical protein
MVRETLLRALLYGLLAFTVACLWPRWTSGFIAGAASLVLAADVATVVATWRHRRTR